MYYLTSFAIPNGLTLIVPKYDVEATWGANVNPTTQIPLPNGQVFDPYGWGDAPADGVRQLIYPCVIVANNSALAQFEAEKWVSLTGKVGLLTRRVATITPFAQGQIAYARLKEVVVPIGFSAQPFLNITLIFEIQGEWRGSSRRWYGSSPTTTLQNGGTRIANPLITITLNGAAVIGNVRLYNDTPGANAALQMIVTGSGSGIDTLTVNTQTQEVKYNGVSIYANLTFLSTHRRIEWMPILPGANALRVYAGGGALQGWDIQYHDSYY